LQLELPAVPPRRTAGRLALAAGAVLWLLAAQLVAVSPEAHHWLHGGAAGAPHECAAVLLDKGLVEPAAGLPALAVPALIRFDPLEPAIAKPVAAPHLLPPGRAPPRA
jgi:hypothetical protein